jgi:phage baseplate assembly protein gpV
VGSGNGLSVSPTATTTYYGRYEDGAPCNYNSACATVTVTNVPAPAVLSITNSGTGVVLVWASVAGANYQVQYTTDLTLPITWTDLGSPVTATGTTATTTDSFGADTQRFYRVSVVCSEEIIPSIAK